jgi:hypothetical protein
MQAKHFAAFVAKVMGKTTYKIQRKKSCRQKILSAIGHKGIFFIWKFALKIYPKWYNAVLQIRKICVRILILAKINLKN